MTLGRINRVAALLEAGEPVFAALIPPPISADAADELADGGFQMVVVETEHTGFDPLLIRNGFQALLRRSWIAEHGLVPELVPIVRIPTTGRENGEWIIKQVLDSGAYGVVYPHIDNPGEARAVVTASCYPPFGSRGYSPASAMRYWGLSMDEYTRRAGPWPSVEGGELLLIAMVESPQAVANLPEILRTTPGIGVVWPGAGDLSSALGVPGQVSHPDVESLVLEALRACEDANVACAASASTASEAHRRLDQGFQVVVAGANRSFRPSQL